MDELQVIKRTEDRTEVITCICTSVEFHTECWKLEYIVKKIHEITWNIYCEKCREI